MYNYLTFNLLPSASEIISLEDFLLFFFVVVPDIIYDPPLLPPPPPPPPNLTLSLLTPENAFML